MALREASTDQKPRKAIHREPSPIRQADRLSHGGAPADQRRQKKKREHPGGSVPRMSASANWSSPFRDGEPSMAMVPFAELTDKQKRSMYIRNLPNQPRGGWRPRPEMLTRYGFKPAQHQGQRGYPSQRGPRFRAPYHNPFAQTFHGQSMPRAQWGMFGYQPATSETEKTTHFSGSKRRPDHSIDRRSEESRSRSNHSRSSRRSYEEGELRRDKSPKRSSKRSRRESGY